jgi:signal peptidase I
MTNGRFGSDMATGTLRRPPVNGRNQTEQFPSNGRPRQPALPPAEPFPAPPVRPEQSRRYFPPGPPEWLPTEPVRRTGRPRPVEAFQTDPSMRPAHHAPRVPESWPTEPVRRAPEHLRAPATETGFIPPRVQPAPPSRPDPAAPRTSSRPDLAVPPTASAPAAPPQQHPGERIGLRLPVAEPPSAPVRIEPPLSAAEQTIIVPGARHGRHRAASKKTPLWKELLVLICVALGLTIGIQSFLARVYVIPSGSMEQTLHGCEGCDNDRVLVDKLIYNFHDPQPGDVVVFKGPGSWSKVESHAKMSDNMVVRWLQQAGAVVGLAPPDESDFIKRVIAVAGQTVHGDADGKVYVDNKPLREPYVYWSYGHPNESQKFAPVTVPVGSVWVMGDNRNNSYDSRFQGGGGVAGLVPIRNVIGKARAVVLPTNRWQGVGDNNPQTSVLGAPGWTSGAPAGVGVAAAIPALWLGRRMRYRLTSIRRIVKGRPRG